MRYITFSVDHVTLTPTNFSDVEWATILKLFGLEETEEIEIKGCEISTYGIPTKSLSRCMRQRCHFCEHDHKIKGDLCNRCHHLSNFKPKKHMSPRMKWEYDMWDTKPNNPG